MSRLDSPVESGRGSAVSSNMNTRLSGSWLVIARIVWLVLVVSSLGFFVVGLPAYYKQIQTACFNAVTCNITGALTAKGLQGLSGIGFSVSGYATFFMIFLIIIVAIWSGTGFLIFWRRSDDWLALLVALFLVIFNATFPGSPMTVLAMNYPALNLPTGFLTVLGQVAIVFFLVLFPNGRLVPRWMGLILLLAIIQPVTSALPPTSPLNQNNWPGWLSGLVAVITYGAIIFSQLYRYRRVSTPVERQQTKWAILGIIIVVTGFIVFGALFTVFFPSINQPNSPYYLFVNLAYPLLLLFIPFSIGFAILRSRLWDIDVIINRALVYGTLTLMLALVYAGVIIGLQFLLRGIIGQSSDIAIVGSTLVIAALFQPLRRRLQNVIDRRFYRRKYDAAKTLAAFSATLRGEVDLSELNEHLVRVVEETMQPRFVWLWVRPMGEEEGKRKMWGRDFAALEQEYE